MGPARGGLIDLEAKDGTPLSADYYPASEEGRPAIVLISMQARDLEWPQSFVDRLHAHDWTVLVPDVRGTGASGGELEDGYQRTGILDVQTYAEKVVADGYPSFALLTEYNYDGVVNAYAFQVDTGTRDGPMPAAMGYLDSTHDSFWYYATEGQLPVLPSVFAHCTCDPEAEGDTALQFFYALEADDPPESWVFHYFDPTGYDTQGGTLMCAGAEMLYLLDPLAHEALEDFYLGLWPD